ncbi:MAG: ribosomal protein S18-alanine N-acetyltransferase, partial [Nitrospirales bacterium]|nr:ribosomal protein S18-alanine N-acetyltransferase [Nitrospirales bacterium]
LSFSTPWSETSFYSEVFNTHAVPLVAEDDGRIIGHVCTRYFIDEAHLLDLAVHPDYRQKGIGALLLENAFRELEAKGCRVLYLEVRVSNSSARKLYEGLGCKPIGIRKRYYLYPTEDALLMMCEL